MNERDELLIIPQADPSGFICPKCLTFYSGKKLEKHANYCPDCGQHIKIDTRRFKKLKEKVSGLSWSDKEKCCSYYSLIAPEGTSGRVIAGIYEKKLEKLIKEHEQIKGQMSITDFLDN
jgi:PHP family Zn ribbon phosphoesterase